MFQSPTVRATRALLMGMIGALAVALAALGGCAAIGGGATHNAAPPATSITTCSQVQGFAGAPALSLPHLQFPAGTVAQPPQASGGGNGQYRVNAYLACAPDTDTNLTVRTGKGPEPFLKLAQFYGWAPWNHFPAGGGAQAACSGSCLAFNAEDPSKGWFLGTPGFLALSDVVEVGKGVVTFNLRVTAPPPRPDCAWLPSGGPAPQYSIWYDQAAGIQYPPDTISSPDDTMSTTGSVQCSPGTLAAVKEFMDHQLAAAGYTSDPCQAYDCWKKGAVVVSLQLTSAAQWFIFIPRVLPTP
ncbi:MAG TPA: hypothetical protein VF808_03360 [Ktedonobacterales bacterium]